MSPFESRGLIMRTSQGMDVTIVGNRRHGGRHRKPPFLVFGRFPTRGATMCSTCTLTPVPYIGAAGELKTKPTQHSVNKLREIGIQPNILLCRTDRYLPPELQGEDRHVCNVEKDAVITAKDVETIYEVPIVSARKGWMN